MTAREEAPRGLFLVHPLHERKPRLPPLGREPLELIAEYRIVVDDEDLDDTAMIGVGVGYKFNETLGS